MRAKLILGVVGLVLSSWSVASAQVKVFVDFTSDVHNGAGGGAGGDGVDWIEELNKATTTVPDFDATERATIEADILSQLSTIYAGYDVTFFTSPRLRPPTTSSPSEKTTPVSARWESPRSIKPTSPPARSPRSPPETSPAPSMSSPA